MKVDLHNHILTILWKLLFYVYYGKINQRLTSAKEFHTQTRKSILITKLTEFVDCNKSI